MHKALGIVLLRLDFTVAHNIEEGFFLSLGRVSVALYNPLLPSNYNSIRSTAAERSKCTRLMCSEYNTLVNKRVHISHHHPWSLGRSLLRRSMGVCICVCVYYIYPNNYRLHEATRRLIRS